MQEREPHVVALSPDPKAFHQNLALPECKELQNVAMKFGYYKSEEIFTAQLAPFDSRLRNVEMTGCGNFCS